MTHSELLAINSQRTTLQSGDAKEWGYFLQFANDHKDLVPYRTEWMIYDEQLKLAGSVDMVYKNSDGSYSIYDWKRSKDIAKTNGFGKTALTECIDYMPDANFWHYTLQLNIYKMILERNYGVRIRDLKLVRLHPDAAHDSYELLDVPIMTHVMHELIDCRLRALGFSVETRAAAL
jgi:ATP-dependent exoDNAse (exonuclease V) beta subunit